MPGLNLNSLFIHWTEHSGKREGCRLGISYNFSIFPSDGSFLFTKMISRWFLAPLEMWILPPREVSNPSPVRLQIAPVRRVSRLSSLLWITSASCCCHSLFSFNLLPSRNDLLDTFIPPQPATSG